MKGACIALIIFSFGLSFSAAFPPSKYSKQSSSWNDDNSNSANSIQQNYGDGDDVNSIPNEYGPPPSMADMDIPPPPPPPPKFRNSDDQSSAADQSTAVLNNDFPNQPLIFYGPPGTYPKPEQQQRQQFLATQVDDNSDSNIPEIRINQRNHNQGGHVIIASQDGEVISNDDNNKYSVDNDDQIRFTGKAGTDVDKNNNNNNHDDGDQTTDDDSDGNNTGDDGTDSNISNDYDYPDPASSDTYPHPVTDATTQSTTTDGSDSSSSFDNALKDISSLLPDTTNSISSRLFPTCSAWQEWEESKCVWPGKTKYSDLPASCRYISTPADLPWAMKQFLAAKESEEFGMAAFELRNRGASSPCGMCARKLRCAIRNGTNDAEFCAQKRQRYLKDADCDVAEPCKINLVDGGCPAPKFAGSSSNNVVITSAIIDAYRKRRKRQSTEGILYDYPNYDNLTQQQLLNFTNYEYAEQQQPPTNDDQQATISSDVADQQDKIWSELLNKTTTDDDSNNSIFDAKSIFNSPESLTPPTWNCVKNKDEDKCLCCCEFYIPDPESETCISVADGMADYFNKQVRSQYDDLRKFLSDDAAVPVAAK